MALFVNSAFRPILEVGCWWTRVAEVDGRDWPVVTIGGCVIGTVRATLWEISPQKSTKKGGGVLF